MRKYQHTTVTVTGPSSTWRGSYRDFQREWIDKLCVSEFAALDLHGELQIGGGITITLEEGMTK